MPLLAYCITEKEALIEAPGPGVQEEPLSSICESGLRCFVSNYRPLTAEENPDVPATALAFNRVLQSILRQVAIVPFRFPTVIPDGAEMSGFLREHAEQYRNALSRLRDVVQMEMRISLQESPPQTQKSSGAEYLRARQARHHKLENAARDLCAAAETWVEEWKQRESSVAIRCFALVRRSSVPAFLGQMEQAKIPSNMTARITGPWPAAEFLKEK